MSQPKKVVSSPALKRALKEEVEDPEVSVVFEKIANRPVRVPFINRANKGKPLEIRNPFMPSTFVAKQVATQTENPKSIAPRGPLSMKQLLFNMPFVFFVLDRCCRNSFAFENGKYTFTMCENCAKRNIDARFPEKKM